MDPGLGLVSLEARKKALPASFRDNVNPGLL